MFRSAHLTAFDAVKAAFAGLLAEEATAERSQTEDKEVSESVTNSGRRRKGISSRRKKRKQYRLTRHQGIHGPSSAGAVVAGIASNGIRQCCLQFYSPSVVPEPFR